MKLAILGGSFNPVHLGHLFLADAALSSLNYDRLVLVPAYRSPFKLAAKGMEDTARDRLDMLAASIAGDPRLTIDDCEIRRKGISYTIDTLRDIIRRYLPDGKPGLIIGDDLAADFPDWHKSGEILELADIIVARRIHSGRISPPYPCRQITNEVMEVSSAMVRERIAGGGAWRYLTPAAVRLIIEDRGLYGFAASPAGARRDSVGKQILRVEEAARETLSPERFLHSRNTALLAWDICRRFGLDCRAAYLAGLAHDLGKPLSGEELLKTAESDGAGISKLEKDKPALLHGRAAAVLLRERFGIHNRDILEAVAWHTEGNAEMGPLAKVVFIADKVEVSRENVNSDLRRICFAGNMEFDRIFYAVLENTVAWLRSKGIEVSEKTLRLLEKTRGGNS
ncbi:MAG: nicotinate (nicotinamide) nucleotide adenylyltransferase [Treponema sp.]|nr:nicotinate (nicotinamide) nucleotide adenylyltransferase [Treponema sp.]